MPLAIIDCGPDILRVSYPRTNARQTRTSSGPWAAASSSGAAGRAIGTIAGPVRTPRRPTVKSATFVVAPSAIRSATSVKTPTAAMGASAASGVTASAVLSKGWTSRKGKTDKQSECEDETAQTGSAHDQYLPPHLGVRPRAWSP